MTYTESVYDMYREGALVIPLHCKNCLCVTVTLRGVSITRMVCEGHIDFVSMYKIILTHCTGVVPTHHFLQCGELYPLQLTTQYTILASFNFQG